MNIQLMKCAIFGHKYLRDVALLDYNLMVEYNICRRCKMAELKQFHFKKTEGDFKEYAKEYFEEWTGVTV